MYSVVVPRELLTVTARYTASIISYTEGSLIDGCIGFAFHRTGDGGFGYKISSPVFIFTAELTALFVTLRHIGEVIQPPENCLILRLTAFFQIRLCCSEKYRIGLIRRLRLNKCGSRLTWGSRVTRLWTNRPDMRH
jgi:hypothetical protein